MTGSFYAEEAPTTARNHMLFIVGVVIVLIAVAILPRMRVPGGVNSANLGWMSEHWLAETSRVALVVKNPVEIWSRDSLKSGRYKMALVFARRLATPLWAMAFFTIALTAPPPATPFLMPPAALFVMAVLGTAAIMFTMRRVIPWVRTSRSVVRAVPSRHRNKTSAAITMAAGTCVRTLDEPDETSADDALDLLRMDDDGGWQMARPPA